MDFRLHLSVRSNLQHSDLPLPDVMRYKEKVNQERTYEEIIKYMHDTTFSNGTSDLTSAWTRRLPFWNTFETICSRKKAEEDHVRKRNGLQSMLCVMVVPFLFRMCLLSNSYTHLRYTKTYRHRSGSFRYVFIIHVFFSSEARSYLTLTAVRMLKLFGRKTLKSQ